MGGLRQDRLKYKVLTRGHGKRTSYHLAVNRQML